MSDPNPFEGRALPPAAATLGHRFLSFDREAMTLTLGFEAREDFVNPMGVVQGGFLTAMIDDTMGPLVMALTGRAGATIDLSVQFLRGVQPGPVTTTARVTRMGRSVAFLEGHLKDSEGRMSVRATSSFFLRG
ncbi:PaaI family thioesterase [Albimonas pacifica]|uniref:Uncharacterized domain 1-containing protein n=1 Tax=Albimonas pacifica TaxID=1114924 RepID=A0A1I3EMJ9_9RHOB|nr:PaaI family thioesterase [Albimonas pacifica]SFI00197.1 uncharacterized domain 1-containing protein [Albimonas pacifica]